MNDLHFTVVNPFEASEIQKQTVLRSEDITEESIGLHQKLYKKFRGQPYKIDGYSPKKRLILKIVAEGESGKHIVLYRAFRGVNQSAEVVSVGPQTYLALQSVYSEDDSKVIVSITPTRQHLGRFIYYWNHPIDAARVSFKLGLVGIIISAILSILWPPSSS